MFTFEYTIKLQCQGNRKIRAENKGEAIFKMRNALDGSIKELLDRIATSLHFDRKGSFQLVEVDGKVVPDEERDELLRDYDMEC